MFLVQSISALLLFATTHAAIPPYGLKPTQQSMASRRGPTLQPSCAERCCCYCCTCSFRLCGLCCKGSKKCYDKGGCSALKLCATCAAVYTLYNHPDKSVAQAEKLLPYCCNDLCCKTCITSCITSCSIAFCKCPEACDACLKRNLTDCFCAGVLCATAYLTSPHQQQ